MLRNWLKGLELVDERSLLPSRGVIIAADNLIAQVDFTSHKIVQLSRGVLNRLHLFLVNLLVAGLAVLAHKDHLLG